MTRFNLTAVLVSLMLMAPLAVGSERPEHFEGKEAETVAQAFANLAEYNDRLSALLAKDELTAEELYQVHQITYTLENALGRLNSELARGAESLERVHLASEENDPQTVREQGRVYLQAVQPMIER